LSERYQGTLPIASICAMPASSLFSNEPDYGRASSVVYGGRCQVSEN
jgi:hypothetical protein